MNGHLFIVGGGASLIGFPWERLQGERVWAINTAFMDVPWAELVYWTDPWVYEGRKAEFDAFRGRKIVGLQYGKRQFAPGMYGPEIEFVTLSGLEGFDERPGFHRHGNNSGYALLHMAIQAKERLIGLLGYDMKAGQTSNYHKRNPRQIQDEIYRTKMLRFFDALVAPAAERGCEIRNLSPDTRLLNWPCCSLADFMAIP